MYHGIQDALGQVAYLKRTIEVLVHRLDELEQLASSADEMDPLWDSQVRDVTGRRGLPIRHHIDVAIEYAGEWQRQLDDIVTSRPR